MPITPSRVGSGARLVAPTQRVAAETTTGTEITLQLIPTRELITQLLSYGADVVVLAPASLRTHIHQVLTQSLAAYN